jgi:hypothetical protein
MLIRPGRLSAVQEGLIHPSVNINAMAASHVDTSSRPWFISFRAPGVAGWRDEVRAGCFGADAAVAARVACGRLLVPMARPSRPRWPSAGSGCWHTEVDHRGARPATHTFADPCAGAGGEDDDVAPSAEVVG